ncbi:MAG: acetylornithine/N-succinyldiaminopimelate aminotransferase [Pseudohongiellaceae bacterium]
MAFLISYITKYYSLEISMTAIAEKTEFDVTRESNPREALWPNYNPPKELVFTHGIGSEVFDEQGNAYLDFLSGIAVTSFGHAHPHLVKALKDQSEKLWHLSNVFRIPEGELLAKRLVENSFADSVFFANSGTEGAEAGIKAIRGYQAVKGNTKRTRIIGLTESFHGRTLAALAAAGNQAQMKGFIPTDYGFDQVQWGDFEALKNAVTDETAGIVFETVQGEGGIRPITQEFVSQVRKLCDDLDLVLMFDEVQCGIGRSGKLFAYEHFDVTPDVMVLAKGLGGGFPIGACLTTAKVGNSMVFGSHGSTFGGNPLAMAVGNAVMDLLLEPNLLSEVSRKGEFLQGELKRLTEEFPDIIESVHGLGLMIGLKCVVPNTDVLVKLREHHMIVGKSGSNMIRLLPPLNMSDEDIVKGVKIMSSVLQELRAK